MQAKYAQFAFIPWMSITGQSLKQRGELAWQIDIPNTNKRVLIMALCWDRSSASMYLICLKFHRTTLMLALRLKMNAKYIRCLMIDWHDYQFQHRRLIKIHRQYDNDMLLACQKRIPQWKHFDLGATNIMHITSPSYA